MAKKREALPPDEVLQAPCVIKLVRGVITQVKKKIPGAVSSEHLDFDRDHGLIHIGSGEVRITPAGSLICFLGEGESRKSFSLWREGEFESVLHADGSVFWPRPEQ
jgi:hypothetical protein